MQEARYQALAGGSEPLQSYLHKRLAENLNSETALGTVCDVAQCVQWLRSTFLYVRAARDPKRYLGLTSTAPDHLILKKIEELCVRAMNGLASAGLITMDEASCIESTEAGRLMSVFYLDLETMKLIMKIQGNESLERLLWIICECHELADMHLRTDERRTLNLLNRNNAAATIRFPMKGKISTRQMKLSCMIQAILGCIPIPDPSLNQEAMKIMRIADRVCKCLVAYVTRPEPVTQQLQYFSAVLNTIILAKCIAAHLWENSSYVSKQLKGIGPTFSTLLATAGKVNFMLLEESHPRDLERIMNKGPPAGNVLRKQISLLPKYQLELTPVDERTVSVKLLLLNQAYLLENMENLTAGPTHKCYVIAGDSENHLLLLTTFIDKDLIRVHDGTITYEITRKHSFEHKISVHCVSSSFVGIDTQCEYTFTDLMPVSSLNVDTSSHLFESNATKIYKKQNNLPDTPKERKRKSNSEEISQSKEKKKRDNALAEKFRLLKESFGRTSTALKKDLQKTEEMTRNVLNNLGYSVPPSTESTVKENNDMNTIVIDENDINFPHNDDDIMDDAKINSILSEIETEITKADTEPTKHVTDFRQKYIHEKNPTSFIKTSNTVKQNQMKGKRINKPGNTKSNYKFLDLLQKNMDLSDEDIPEPVKDTGFTDAIKLQINTFIQNSYKAPDSVDLTISNLYQLPESTEIKYPKVNSINEEVNDEHIISPDKKLQADDIHENKNEEKSKETERELGSYDLNDVNLKYTSKTSRNGDSKTIMEEELPEVNVTGSITELVSTSLDTRRETGKMIQTHDVPENKNAKKSNETGELRSYDLSDEKIEDTYKFNRNGDSKSYIEKKLPEINLTGPFTELVPTRRETDEKHENNEKCYSLTAAAEAKNNSNNTYIYFNEQIDEIEPPLTMINNSETITNNNPRDTSAKVLNDTKEVSVLSADNDIIKTINDNNNNSPYRQSQLVPLFKKPASITTANQLPVYNSTIDLSLWRKQQKESELGAEPIKKSITNVIEENRQVGTLRGSPANSINHMLFSNQSIQHTTLDSNNYRTNSEATKNRSTEYENKYSFSAEQIDVQTKYTTDHKIHIIKRLKVDLDVREIVSNYDKENSNDPDSIWNKQEITTDICSARAMKSTTLNSLEAKKYNFTHNSLSENQNDIISKEMPKNPFIDEVNNQTYGASVIESIQEEDKEQSKVIATKVNTKSKEALMLEGVRNDADTTHQETMNNDDLPSTERSIGNILQKYAQIIRKNKNSEVKSSSIFSTSSVNNSKQATFKPNRPFKISEIQNLNVLLPTFIENVKPTPTFVSKAGNIQSSIANRTEIPQKLTEIHNPPEKTHEHLELTPCPSPEHLLKKSLEISEDDFKLDQSILKSSLCPSPEQLLKKSFEISEDDFKIDQSMLNPKTLLLNMGKDDTALDIIPPPPEFCNDDINYSPEFDVNEDLKSSSYFEKLNQTFEERHNTSVFENVFPDTSNLTPSKEIETWNLDRDNEFDNSLNYTTPAQSYTVLRRKMFQNYKSQDTDGSKRQGRLSQFKFKGKNKLKM
ncbi:hypothetical protein ABMA28_016978 [Loxostege sticticalis]|uniref:DNA 3'-5' helicase n=1 Tax=Loxostege sticticalis TaxID=481309 RepID=A0ABD0T8B4_LOXSC